MKIIVTYAMTFLLTFLMIKITEYVIYSHHYIKLQGMRHTRTFDVAKVKTNRNTYIISSSINFDVIWQILFLGVPPVRNIITFVYIFIC